MDNRLVLGPLEFENFMSYAGKHVINLDAINGGAVLIEGKTDDPKSPSNGAGKTAIFDAVKTAMHGTPIRKLRYADDVVFTDAKLCRLHQTFWKNGKEYTIERIRKRGGKGTEVKFTTPDETYTKTAAQEKIDAVIGFSSASFDISVLWGKDFDSFTDLRSAERFQMFTELFPQIVAWDEAKDRASTEVSRVTTLINTVNLDIRDLETTKATTEERVVELEKEEAGHKAAQEERVDGFRRDLLKAEENKRLVDGAITNGKILVRQMLEELGEERKKHQAKINKLAYTPQAEKEVRAKLRVEDKRKTELSTEYKMIKKELNQYTGLVEGPCSNCGQPVTGKYIEKQKKEIDKRLFDVDQSLQSQEEKVSDIEIKLEALETKKEKVEEVQNELRLLDTEETAYHKSNESLAEGVLDKDSLTDLYNNDETRWKATALPSICGSTGTSMKAMQEAIEAIERLIMNEGDKANPFTKLHKAEKEKLKGLRTDIRKANKEHKTLADELQYWTFWVTGMAKGKSKKIDSMLAQFEDLVNVYMDAFSSTIRVSFDTERETRAGGVKNEFDIIVHDGKKELPFTLWSSGQKQKVRLAVCFGLADMLYESQDNLASIILLDEPNDGLDESGRDQLFWAIKNRCQKYNQTMIVTDHNAEFKQHFDGVITVVMEDDRSSIQS